MPKKAQGNTTPPTRTALVQFRTTPDFKKLLAAVAVDFGDNATAAIEFLVRDYARKNRITAPDVPALTPGKASLTADPRAGYTAAASDPATTEPTTDPATRGGTGRDADG